MSGLVAAGRDVVHVHVEGTGRSGVQGEPGQARLLVRLAQSHLLAARLSGVAVAPRLQPTVELAVVQEQHAFSPCRDHEGARGQVALRDAPVEGVGMS